MIRITARHESKAIRLFLEGKLSGPCVAELDKCWRESTHETALLVDLTNISFVDDQGVELLSRMHKQGARLSSSSLMTKCLIARIKRRS